jgi:hypothetical protein
MVSTLFGVEKCVAFARVAHDVGDFYGEMENRCQRLHFWSTYGKGERQYQSGAIRELSHLYMEDQGCPVLDL